MGETLAETRIEVEGQRTKLQATADRLETRVRRAVDIRARFRENPILFIGLGAGAVFLLAGGPVRVARLLRRRVAPTRTERAYDTLPKSMQAWVDAVVGQVGPRAEKARDALAEDLEQWRRQALGSKKARRELARTIAEGPPGPSRTAWKAAEAGLTLVTAALARRAIERFISGEPVKSGATKASAGGSGQQPLGERQYSGFSAVERSASERP
jgi:hypothetical protein